MSEPHEEKPSGEEEPTPGEPASKSDEEKIKDLDPNAEIPSGTQEELLKRYKEQLAGQQKGFEKVLGKMSELEEKIANVSKRPESPLEASAISEEDKPYLDYYKKLGLVQKEDVERMFQERIAPLTESQKTTQKAEQQRIINSFIQKHPELSKEEDLTGEKMSKVIERLRRVAPEVPNNPNYSLDEDLELAYNWAFGKSDLEEFRQKAKASGVSAAFEALETQVGGGSSISAPKETKTRTPEQEAIMKDFGVDDETLSKKKYPKQGE